MNVIFDMDGLMFDTESVFVKAWDYAGEQMGIGKTGYMTLKTLGMNIAASKEIWISEFGERYNEQELRKYTKQFLTDYYAKNKVPVKKGLYVLLSYLKENGVKMAVASSSPKWEVEKHLRDADVYEYFMGIVCGDMIERSKPHPEIYLKACALLGSAPGDTYALEDSKNGLLSAYKAGCKPVMIPDLWQPDEEVLQIIIGKFDDLEQVKIAFENGTI
ncbi:MAG: HAD family phosphatase [Lachnospiraceae bacterium]|nr:HAD family phosphatase [Lachnospiraceae bacterium]